MLWMAVNWIWIFISVYIVGFCVCRKIKNDEFWNDVGVRLIAGIIVTGTFVQTYALFRPLGVDVYIVHAVAVFFATVYSWKEFIEETAAFFRKKSSWDMTFMFLAMVIAVCFLRWTTLPSANYDDYLYHIQQIRWVQEYGTVLGLGNIHARLAFTSSMLHLQGLYSWAHILRFGQGIYGFVGWFSCVVFLYGGYYLTRRKYGFWENTASKIVAMVILIYLLSNFRTIAGLHTDICPNLFVLFIYLQWFQLLERNEEDLSRYIFLCVCAAFSMTLNLSSASAVFLCLIPLVTCFKGRKIREAVCLVGGTGVVVMPMMARSVIQSGYPLWPSRFLDIFQFKWKIPLGVMENYAREVTVWARQLQHHMEGLTYEEALKMPFMDWFPFWFRMQEREIKILVVLSTVFIPVLAVLFVVRLVRKKGIRAVDLTSLVVIFSVLFWGYMGPTARFGANTMWILAAIGIRLLSEFKGGKPLKQAASCVVACVVCFYLVFAFKHLGDERKFKYKPPRFDIVIPYEEVTVYSDEGDSAVIYVNTESDLQGYDVFPASPYKSVVSSVKLLGNDISGGFYTVADGQ